MQVETRGLNVLNHGPILISIPRWKQEIKKRNQTPHVTSVGSLKSFISLPRKNGSCAVFLLPHLLTVLNIRESKQTAEISNSIVALDNLAREVDCIIDTRPANKSMELSCDSFERLGVRIAECFQHLSDTARAERLISDTLKAVNVSFRLNTESRGQVYNLRDIELRTCTTNYLLPLVQYLSSLSENRVDVTRLFFLIANYVQILDDYVDVLEDIDAHITTPLTLRWLELRSEQAIETGSDFAFNRLTSDVLTCLGRYLDEIVKESRILNSQLGRKFFVAWEEFHEQWASVPAFPSLDRCGDYLNWSVNRYRNYLNRIHRITPPFLCYS